MSVEISFKILRGLAYLSGRPFAELARELNADNTNLVKFLKRGAASIAQEKKIMLAQLLGLDPETGTMTPNIHHWDWNPLDVPSEHLQEIIRETLPGGGIVMPISVPINSAEGIKQRFLTRPGWVVAANIGPCAIIYESPKTKFIQIIPPNLYRGWLAKPFKLEERDWNWKKVKIVSPEEYIRLICDKSTTVSEVREMLNLPPLSTNKWTWGRVMVMLQKQYPSAEDFARKFHLDKK
uniref:Uncharacterized protein n=1 Tax=Leptospirillum sp. Group II '5-way CG' TaxID=419541 RepID=B6ALG2_9BACT|nr:MAG: Hypothetical protein CGL2_11346195 [Leptospirillum sp. Group II '5-way CG']